MATAMDIQDVKYAMRDYHRWVLFGNDERVSNAPLFPGFVMGNDTREMGFEVLKNGGIVECTEEMYDDLLGCLPPTEYLEGQFHCIFLVGEPAAHLKDGQAVYTAGLAFKGRHYLQDCTEKQFSGGLVFRAVLGQK
jgi:hypothetical protein